jgi:hypothetical protein
MSCIQYIEDFCSLPLVKHIPASKTILNIFCTVRHSVCLSSRIWNRIQIVLEMMDPDPLCNEYLDP